MPDEKKAETPVPAPVEKPDALTLEVRGYTIVIDSVNRSPAGLATEIVEVAFYPINRGNGDWMHFMDVMRFRCERGKASKILEGLGLKPKDGR